MEELTRQLLSEGLRSRPAYLEGSALLIGHQLELPPIRSPTGWKGDVLILCALQRERDARSRPQQLLRLMAVLRRVFQALRWLVSVRMLVIADVFDSALARKRQQLVQVLLSLGAAVLARLAVNEPVLYILMILLPPPERALWPKVPSSALIILEQMLCPPED